MTTLNPRKVQRKANLYVRRINQALQADRLWGNRIYVYQIDRNIIPYSDHSGLHAEFRYKFIDKKTGKEAETCWIYFGDFFVSHILRDLNEVITKDWKL